MEDDKKTPAATPVLRLTEAALRKVRALAAAEGMEGGGLRVSVVTGGCAGMSYDLRFQKEPYPNDVVWEQEGQRIMVNEESVPFLRGTEIDYVETLKESGFKYKNPNAGRTCSCGTSFA